MAKTKKHKAPTEGHAKTSGQSSAGKAPASCKPAVKTLMADLPAPAKTVATYPADHRHWFKQGNCRDNSGTRPAPALPAKATVTQAEGIAKTSFAGLFSNNRKLTEDNKLMEFTVDEGPLKLDSNDLIDVQAKLGHCLVRYIVGKFPGLRAIRALAQSWGASFQQHVSGWLIFHFARDEDRHRILVSGPYFIFGRPLMLKNMPDCFEFKEDDISLTPVWATLPSLPLECWNPKALGKIGSRIGTPIAMDSLTRKMKRVSYARILVEVDASKKLVDSVEFIIPNGVTRKQPVPAPAALRKAQPDEWSMVQRRHKKHQGTVTVGQNQAQIQKQQQHNALAATSDDQGWQGLSQQQLTISAAGNEKQDQPGLSGQAQNATSQVGRRAVIGEHSPAGSSGSSTDSSSPFMMDFIAPIALKQKQKMGGDAPPHSP
ncbi:hypothetical protein Salat_1058000 [Sesamum alatum]|uniref:DUF4283 domain-containing protein n=1 Tax=Sesamum alatum TaxID=300844 RepID=A0AAE1YNP0_9LAMI|nr:hypothetical protein Salat_1058000 [Sesamum alatum]